MDNNPFNGGIQNFSNFTHPKIDTKPSIKPNQQTPINPSNTPFVFLSEKEQKESKDLQNNVKSNTFSDLSQISNFSQHIDAIESSEIQKNSQFIPPNVIFEDKMLEDEDKESSLNSEDEEYFHVEDEEYFHVDEEEHIGREPNLVADMNWDNYTNEYDSDEEFSFNPNDIKTMIGTKEWKNQTYDDETLMQDFNVKASATTIPLEGQNIKGGELIQLMHDVVQSTFTSQSKTNPPQITGGSDWLKNVGRFSQGLTKSDKKPDKQADSLNSIKGDSLIVSIGGTKLELKKSSGYSERLMSPEEWQPGNLVSPDFNRDGFSYKEISSVLTTHFKQFSDSEVAEIILNQLKGREIKDLDDSLKEKAFDLFGKEHKSFINTLNFLMFGVETSRNNNSFLTGVMTLELIQAGKMTFKQAFADNELGGEYPMACLKTGSGNLSRLSQIKMGQSTNFPSLKTERSKTTSSEEIFEQYPHSPISQQEAVTNKEASIAIQWLNMNQSIPDYETNKKNAMIGINNAMTDLMKKYFA